jgi:hypothetical protein
LRKKIVVAFSYIPRLFIKANGAFQKDELESILLRFSLPGLENDFKGDVASKTYDYRMAIATKFNRWNIGASIGEIKCKTIFEGVLQEEPNNYQTIVTNAKGIGIDIGAQYLYNENLKIGATLKHLDAKLDVKTVTTDNNGETSKIYTIPFPTEINIGFDYRYSNVSNFLFSYQNLFGKYGGYDIDFQLLKIANSFKSGDFKYNAGLISVLKLESPQIEKIDLPLPMFPTTGLEWQKNALKMDLVFYVHPIMSYHTKTIQPAVDISLSYNF